MLCSDTAVLRGEHRVTVYGCRRILHYAPDRICLCIGKRGICISGRELICTSFNAGTVTVAGEILGLQYCDEQCHGHCKEERKDEA